MDAVLSPVDKVVAQGPMRTQPGTFTLSGHGLCIGYDSGDNVSQVYTTPARLTGGTILGVAVSVGKNQYLDLEKLAAAALAGRGGHLSGRLGVRTSALRG